MCVNVTFHGYPVVPCLAQYLEYLAQLGLAEAGFGSENSSHENLKKLSEKREPFLRDIRQAL